MSDEKKTAGRVGVRIIKSQDESTVPTVFYHGGQQIEKSDKSEQLNRETAVSAADWIPHPVNMYGLKELVDNSTILPQCIKAYKSNIAGFGISVHYREDYDEETPEMKAEWTQAERIISLLNMDCMTKEVFEDIVRDRETYGMLSDFVDDHPAVVSAFEGMALALGIFTVAMGAYSAATLIAKKATDILTAAMAPNPIFLVATALAAVVTGVTVFVSSLGEAEEAQEKLTGSSLKLSNEIERQKQVVESLKEEYGTNNDKTLEAQARLNELQAEYDETKKTVEDFESQIRQTIDAVDESIAAYDKASGELNDQSFYAMSLVTELEKLQSQSALTAFQLQYEKQVVAELNAIYPDLGLSYDEVTRKLGNSTEYLKKYCEQKNEERRLELDSQQYAEYSEKMAALERDRTEAQQNLNDAKSEYNRLMSEFSNAANGNEWSSATANLVEYQEGIAQAELAMESAQDSVNELTAEMNILQTSMNALEAVSDLTAAAINGIDGASDNLIETTGDLRVAMEGIFKDVQEQATELAEAYRDAYDAAASAVDSSFGMFEKIEQKSKMSTHSMIDAWKSQEEYLLEYAANIEKAKEYGIDASLVENLADGSQESAAALDTIIAKVESLGTSTDAAKGYIKDMNDSFSRVQDAKLTLEDAMVSANTTLNAKMEELKASIHLHDGGGRRGCGQDTVHTVHEAVWVSQRG